MLRSATQALLVALLLQLATYASAHMMPAQQGTVNLLDNVAFVVLSLPLSGLKNLDKKIDGDGRLSEPELQLHHAIIEQQVMQRVRFYNGTTAGMVDFIQISTQPDDHEQQANTPSAGSSQFLVLMKITFAVAPTKLRMETDFFGDASNEKQFAIKAISGKKTEAIILRVGHPEYHFFRPVTQVLGDFIVIGCEHILFGFDHLLFLLTVIVAAAGWRYWFAVLTSFTLAHSITLSLSLMGWINAPAQIIEPLIAASIALMAALNLWQRHATISQRLAIVFACGLLHGSGFASAMADIGLHTSNRMMSLIGFNLGIELGQALFLIALLVLGSALAQLKRVSFFAQINFMFSTKTVTSVLAFFAGIFWMLQRTLVY